MKKKKVGKDKSRSGKNPQRAVPQKCPICGAPMETVKVSGGWGNDSKKSTCSVNPSHSVSQKSGVASMFN